MEQCSPKLSIEEQISNNIKYSLERHFKVYQPEGWQIVINGKHVMGVGGSKPLYRSKASAKKAFEDQLMGKVDYTWDEYYDSLGDETLINKLKVDTRLGYDLPKEVNKLIELDISLSDEEILGEVKKSRYVTIETIAYLRTLHNLPYNEVPSFVEEIRNIQSEHYEKKRKLRSQRLRLFSKQRTQLYKDGIVEFVKVG